MTAAGIEGVTLHKLRNAFAIGAMEAGAPATWIMEQGGWKKMETLQRYAQWAPGNSGKILAERLGQHWGQVTDKDE